MQAFTNRLAMGEAYFAKNSLTMSFLPIMAIGSGVLVQDVMLHPILEYLIQVNRLKNLTNKILISING